MLFIFFFAFPTMINENLSILKAIKKAKKSFRQNMGKKIKIILLLKFFLFIAAIIFSMAEIDGIGTLADLFMSSTLAYLLIYTPEEILPTTEKLTTENE
jgi:uncharacterized membrane protein